MNKKFFTLLGAVALLFWPVSYWSVVSGRSHKLHLMN